MVRPSTTTVRFRLRRAAVRRRQDRWAVLALLSVVVLVAIGIVRGDPGEVRPWSLPSGSLYASPFASLDGDGEPVPIPTSGPGTFVIGTTQGTIIGSAGPLKRFRIAVESNVAEEMEEFTQMVELALGDPRSWIADKKQTLHRVPDGNAFDFTISLVTRETAHRLCSTRGLDIRENGIPYTSCQITGQVVINLDRWHLAVPDYGASLETYRLYVINHEVGHVLGHPHEPCPQVGAPAPVMQQQSLGLGGCLANPWPYPDQDAVT